MERAAAVSKPYSSVELSPPALSRSASHGGVLPQPSAVTSACGPLATCTGPHQCKTAMVSHRRLHSSPENSVVGTFGDQLHPLAWRR